MSCNNFPDGLGSDPSAVNNALHADKPIVQPKSGREEKDNADPGFKAKW